MQPACPFPRKLFIFKTLMVRQGGDGVGQSGSAWPARRIRRSSQQARRDERATSPEFPPRTTLTGDP